VSSPCNALRSEWVGGDRPFRGAGPIAALVRQAQEQLDRPLIDETGLPGNYEWSTRFRRPGTNGEAPEFVEAIRKDLGLRIVPKTRAYEVLVIDSVEMPTANQGRCSIGPQPYHDRNVTSAHTHPLQLRHLGRILLDTERRRRSSATSKLAHVRKVCIVGASGKLGQYMVQHALDRGYEVVGVCRAASVEKLDAFKERITIIPGATNDREVINRAVASCDGVLVVLAPMGVHQYASGTAQAVLDYARPGARLVFSCGWHITRDGKDVYSWKIKLLVHVVGRLARLARVVDLDDQVEACRRVFASNTRWTVVRGSDLEEGESQGLPVWSRHVGDPILASNITRRVDFALFMVAALENDALVHEAPAIVGCKTPSALALEAVASGDG